MSFSLLHILLQTTEIVGKGFEYWGAFGMVIALLVSAIIYLVADRKRILEREREREIKHEEEARETITLMVKVEERMSSMNNFHVEINEIVKGLVNVENRIDKGQTSIETKIDVINDKLNGQK